MERPVRSLSTIAASLLLLAACTASSSPSVVGPGDSGASGGPSPSAAASASARPPSSPAPSTAPAASTAPSPSPTTAPVVGWSKPTIVRRGDCRDVSAAVDESGRSHVAAVCDGGIRYLTSIDRKAWDEVAFVPPIDMFELEPRVAIDGTKVYVAYSLLAPKEGGCGDEGLLDQGVYVRSLQAPDAGWSDPVRIGSEGDRVQAFRVADGVIHLTVTNDDGRSIFYQSKSAAGSTRIGIPGAISTSLRVGDDGRARIGYVTDHAMRYGVVEGEALKTGTVAETTKTFFRWPSLILATGDRASMVWTQTTESGGGCAGPGPGPLDGTYVATQRADGWGVERITKADGQTSLTLDPSSGSIEVFVVGGQPNGGVRLFTKAPGGWASEAIPIDKGIAYPVLRHDPSTGALVLFGLSNDGVVVLSRS